MNWRDYLFERHRDITPHETDLYFICKDGLYLEYCLEYKVVGWRKTLSDCNPIYGRINTPTCIYHFTKQEIILLIDESLKKYIKQYNWDGYTGEFGKTVFERATRRNIPNLYYVHKDGQYLIAPDANIYKNEWIYSLSEADRAEKWIYEFTKEEISKIDPKLLENAECVGLDKNKFLKELGKLSKKYNKKIGKFEILLNEIISLANHLIDSPKPMLTKRVADWVRENELDDDPSLEKFLSKANSANREFGSKLYRESERTDFFEETLAMAFLIGYTVEGE